MTPLKILIKFPSRGRPERFFKALNSCVNNIQDAANFHVSCTLDTDDEKMNCPEVINAINRYPNVSIAWGSSVSKVDAVNRSMPDYPWDIVIVHSDDMAFTFYGFDTIVRQAFEDGLDWLVHIPDNDAGSALATMYIAGRDFYNRFGYIYNPIFSSLFCDNAIHEISQKIKRYKYLDVPGLIFHANAAYGHMERDALFDEQQKIGWTEDQITYDNYKARNFDL